MATLYKPTKRQMKEYDKWVASRPAIVRAMAERLNPWTLYRMKSTGQRVTVASFFEDGTVSVDITGEFNIIMFDRNVFGIDPADLIECDLPSPGEVCGTIMSSEDVHNNIDALRLLVRPDLYVDVDRKAVRRQ